VVSADLSDRVFKPLCYGIPLTFFFEILRPLTPADNLRSARDFLETTQTKLQPTTQNFRLDILPLVANNPTRSRHHQRKVIAMASPPSDELLVEFQGRMSFLETMWGCKTAYDVDLETGRGWLEVRMPGTGAVLRINRFNVKDVMVPGEGGAQPSVK
jgi:hypothetical protein